MDKTDYQSGDVPVEDGTWVFYQGSGRPGVYVIDSHKVIADMPERERATYPEDAYPDGRAYNLWPIGVAHKMGNGDLSRVRVRRTSFRVHVELEKEIDS